MPKIILLQGPPAVGKSTWRRRYILDNPEWRYVNLDEIREANQEMPEYDRLRIMWATAIQYAHEGISFIVDNTNTNPKTVTQWERFAAQYNYDLHIEKLYIPYTDATYRDSYRPNPVGKSVIWKMFVDLGYNPLHDNALNPFSFPEEAIIIDLDGTLCDVEHRRHFVLEKPKNWIKFYAGLVNDTVNKPVAALYHMAKRSKYHVIFVSGRPAQYRKETEIWLKKHGFDFTLLLMRSFNDKRDDTIVKEEIYDKYIAPYFKVVFTVDDRDRVVKMWRDKGIPCFQVAYGDF